MRGFASVAMMTASMGLLPMVAPPLAASAKAATIACSSFRQGYQRCPADTRRGVQLVSQMSRSACVQGRSWGYDRDGVWVDQGCAASFSVGDRGGGGGGHSGVGAAIVGGLVGGMFASAIGANNMTQRTVTHVTTRTYRSPTPPANPWASSEREVQDLRAQSRAAGLDPDTDVMAAQVRQNEPRPESASDAVRRDQARIDSAIADEVQRTEMAGVMTRDPSSSDSGERSDSDQRAEFQANQDFQRAVMERRANENAGGSSDSDDSAASEETPS